MKKYSIGELEFGYKESSSHLSKEDLLYLYWIYHPRFRFFKNVPDRSRFLDIGAGSGGLQFWRGWHLPNRNDIDMYAVDLAEGEFFNRYTDFQICNLDLQEIKYENNFFDVVFLSHVLEHIHDENRFLRNITRPLKNGGRIYLEIPTPETLNYPSRALFLDQGINVSTMNFFDDRTHVKTYDLDRLEEKLNEVKIRVYERGCIENKFAEDKLFSYGISHNDQELLTYAVWSKLRWAHYIIGEKVES
jgi:SAM-dependent methyltransferase